MVRPGIEVLTDDRSRLIKGARVGLLAHAASVSRDLVHAVDLLRRAGAEVIRLFAPEHGVSGALQDMVPAREERDRLTGLPVVSLYGVTEDSLTPRREHFAGIEVLVADLVDVGARYYTFAATVIRALPVAAASGVRVIVADRPNPLGGVAVEGNLVAEGWRSFVGELPIPNRHGLTLGELCLFAKQARGLDVDLTVVPAAGWRRKWDWEATGLPWTPPSPNMPATSTAWVYPGMCLLEGTNLSEGRGTTLPFELAGAPWLDPRALAARLTGFDLPGVLFRPVVFRPAFHKYSGEECGGVQLHVRDRDAFRPVVTGLSVVAAARELAPDAFRWREAPYEHVTDRLAFDLLAGTPTWRAALEAGEDPRTIAAGWAADEAAFRDLAAPARLHR